MKIIENFWKQYTAWKWLRRTRKELKAKLKENEERRKREWKSGFITALCRDF